MFIKNEPSVFSQILSNVRKHKPLIHCITNYVSANDCANAILAIGASPIMADDLQEVEDIVKLSKALVLNIGTLNSNTIESMIIAGNKANSLNIPVIFDPVGAGASTYRNETTQKLLQSIKMTIIRGNLSEVGFIAGLDVSTKGVDTSDEDSNKDSIEIANKVAKEYNCIAAITGAIDTISDGFQVARIHRGSPELSRVTGTGCMTTALIGAFCGAIFATKEMSQLNYFNAAIAGISAMGSAGEIAEPIAKKQGTASYRNAIIDTLSQSISF